ncbi:ferredoxin-NADP reductase [Salirhabdus euzebyi]|uniref:Ferredoxin-NADP reductase n=1 Tax=Salirhabdus euzebyi TaxID=394506 RepID=A0A841Q487_9BACI|nr:FAD-dependent oxidoreductase [Salirhabdus euzebyi]MBB6453231.1 ferredoxin-NADP reductase [Salirhabdus euzebyi]
MGFIQDVSAILKKNELVFLERHKESDNIFTFIFEKNEELHWKAGQHGIFTITHKKVKKPSRPFSIASAPSEKVFKITMEIKDNPSAFKQAITELKKGMRIQMRGPVGPLYVKENTNFPVLFIAGGIGITPFRSIIKELENNKEETNKVDLLYFDSKEIFLFKEEIEEITGSTNLNVHFVKDRKELYERIDYFLSIHQKDRHYYLAGPKFMIRDVSHYLKNQNISKSI